ncbi:MAG: tRNA (N(6)-L-threonylcarbamoyladenosine(37)-C(2))-methylthiotransferase MtaB [Alphaproteobacteria bacterium]|nr:tRNA (N(6)-L-threonylcarbamoyladenosine(37)-C(2))-methylthiotransferase MtaB [Alphaproteobacteria bacterium]
MNSQPEVLTFGCRLNSYESEVVRQHALAAGLTDTVIINTCAVTAEAERQARQSIRRLRRERPSAQILVTGCAAQINPDIFAAMPEVNYVIGNDKKLEADTFRHLNGQRLIVNDIQMVRETAAHLVQGFEGSERAFVQIQNGCDHRCTFCIIPYGRGPSRSVPIGQIADQVRALAIQGYNEVVFTGVDIASYGKDLPGQPVLGQMIRRVLALVPGLRRLRLSSLDPAAMDEDLWRLIDEEPRLMPHLHLSLQAGDDMILKRMKRRHLRDDVLALCKRARQLRPDIAFGADIIAGFPTENDAMFQNTYDLVEQCGLTWLHVFPYSARKGTPAAKMPQLHGSIRKERAERLRTLGAAASHRHHASLVGQKIEVLVEQQGLGCTPHFAKIKLQGDAPVGSLIMAECFALEDGQAIARII